MKFRNFEQGADSLHDDASVKEMDVAHRRTEESLSFIKENLFNPHEGLWAETKQNSQFRDDSKKWRFPIGVGFISLVIKNIWDSITS